MTQYNDSRKLPFADLWKQHCGFGDAMVPTIADLASVNKSVVENMLAGKRVNCAEAVQVLTILSHHLGKWVSLNTIHVPVTEITDGVGQKELGTLFDVSQQHLTRCKGDMTYG